MKNHVILVISISMLAAVGMSFSRVFPEYANNKAPPATSSTDSKTGYSLNSAPSFNYLAQTIEDLVPKIEVRIEDNGGYGPAFITHGAQSTEFWWPNILSLAPLKKHAPSNPLGYDFKYSKAFANLDIKAVRSDFKVLLKNSKDWWPADFGHYGPFFIRMAWHSAGTYRATDGRGGSDGGQMRFEPLKSWPDNANLDKARRLIQPLVEKYSPNLSWADAMILAGDIAMRDMGFPTLGVAGGRTDDRLPDMVYWGPEDEFLKSNRFDKEGNLMLPLAASVMGLIYVNPEGPDGKPDPLLSAKRIRLTFGRMGMNDEETVALVAGGHTFGKAHGAHESESCVVTPAPLIAPFEGQPTGSQNHCGKGNAENTITSGLEGAWTPQPIKWTHEYLTNLYKYEWSLKKGPGGKYQWYAINLDSSDLTPNAHIDGVREPIMMLTTDLALRFDPIYNKISKKFLEKPKEFSRAFARAWFKLIHRDMGPKSRYLGNDFPKQNFLWQDSVPALDHELITDQDARNLKSELLKSPLTISELVTTAWAAAVTYRGTDMRGGANGARLRLAPQKDWAVNEPELLAKKLLILEEIQEGFNEANLKSKKKVSLADLIVLGGNAAVEEAANKAGYQIKIPFYPGRTDASQEQTDVKSFNLLKVTSDGFRNYYDPMNNYLSPAKAFVDRADLLSLTIPEMVVLTGGLRVLGANYGGSPHGVFTQETETLTNDFFVNLMNLSTVWSMSDLRDGVFIGRDIESGEVQWTATTHDLIFGSQPELRAVAFAYSSSNAKSKFINDFAKAWHKVMTLDRFDVEIRRQ